MKTKPVILAVVLLSAIAVITGCQKNSSTPTPAPTPATVKIDSTNNLQLTGVTINFTVTPNDSQISESGLAYGTGTDSTKATTFATEANTGIITQTLSELDTNTKYNIWAYTKTANGIIYSKKVKVWTYAVMDYDGNGYHAVTIAGKVFTVENLKATHYRNGDPIPNITDNNTWYNTTTGAMCWYDNNRAKYDSIYGALYNWYVVNDSRGIAPKGWHVPSSYEWLSVVESWKDHIHLGGYFKETGTKHWKAPNTGATNSTGFTALPGGDRTNIFEDLGEISVFWDSDTFMGSGAMATFFKYNNNYIYVSNGFKDLGGFSVRLVKN